jgi:hypothetical protein
MVMEGMKGEKGGIDWIQYFPCLESDSYIDETLLGIFPQKLYYNNVPFLALCKVGWNDFSRLITQNHLIQDMF